jgi:hypothetical protein
MRNIRYGLEGFVIPVFDRINLLTDRLELIKNGDKYYSQFLLYTRINQPLSEKEQLQLLRDIESCIESINKTLKINNKILNSKLLAVLSRLNDAYSYLNINTSNRKMRDFINSLEALLDQNS